MKLTIEHRDNRFDCDTSNSNSLAITLDFEGPQPNHFGTEKAKREVLTLGSFQGDTEAGGSCNVNTLSLIPHCNGTHTETISHIVNEDIWIGHAATAGLMVAVLLTVRPVHAQHLSLNEKKETYRPELDPSDLLITRPMLEKAVQTISKFDKIAPTALIIRTLPNEVGKQSRVYGDGEQKVYPPFFTIEAVQYINDTGIQHLLVDFPSVDRMYDDGMLTNHHIFWNVKEGEHTVNAESRQDKTITEMAFVNDDLKDGLYVLNLQIPAFGSDAAPSRPVIFPAKMS